MRPASLRICKWRLKLPSVNAHSSLRSLKIKPLGCVIRDVMMLRRAFSWMTRSSPSYANRPGESEIAFFLLIGPSLQSPVKNGGGEHLPDAERHAHRPRG